MNKTRCEEKITQKASLLVWLIASLLLLCLYYTDERFTEDYFGSVSLFYHNPLVIIQAISLFLFFKKIKFHSKVINNLAAAGFTCFLLQGFILHLFRKEFFLYGNPVLLIGFYFGVAVVIFLLSYLVFHVYNICTKWLIDRLEKISIVYYD